MNLQICSMAKYVFFVSILFFSDGAFAASFIGAKGQKFDPTRGESLLQLSSWSGVQKQLRLQEEQQNKLLQKLYSDAVDTPPEGSNRYAIAFYGGVTPLNGTFQSGAKMEAKMDVNISLVASMLSQNLVGPADVFMHSWSPPLKEVFTQLYQPKVAVFEDNEDYRAELERLGVYNWTQASMALTMSKVLKLVADYQDKTGHTYDSVYLCRPDVLLRKRINLNRSSTDEHIVYNTRGNGGLADFHFLMDGRVVSSFAKLYDSIPTLKSQVRAHRGWIQEALALQGLKTLQDDVSAGSDEEVYRKIQTRSPALKPLWQESLKSSLPSECLEDLMSGHVRDSCLVPVSQ